MKQSACALTVLSCLTALSNSVLSEPPATSAKDNPAVSQTTAAQLSDSSIPLVIAHRGASGYLPEHTIEAAVFAHALGADYIEQDVVLTQDGRAVVMHDVTLNKTTNVADVFPDRHRDGKYFVFDFTLAELKRLSVMERIDASKQRFPRGPGRFQICTLAEQIEVIHGLNHSRSTDVGLYVEIKQPALHRKEGLDPSRTVLKILEQYGYRTRQDRVFLQCFESDELQRLRTELKCRLSLIQLLSKTPAEEELAQIARVADGIGVALSAVIAGRDHEQPQLMDLVPAARRHALQVHVWTLRADKLPDFVDSVPQLLQRLVAGAGVDGVFTDHPDVVLRWRQQTGRERPQKGPFHLLQNRTSRDP